MCISLSARYQTAAAPPPPPPAAAAADTLFTNHGYARPRRAPRAHPYAPCGSDYTGGPAARFAQCGAISSVHPRRLTSPSLLRRGLRKWRSACLPPPPCGGLRSSLKHSRPGGTGRSPAAGGFRTVPAVPPALRRLRRELAPSAAWAATPAEDSRPLSGEPGPACVPAGGVRRKGLWGVEGYLMDRARLSYRGAFLRARCVFKPHLCNSRKSRQAFS